MIPYHISSSIAADWEIAHKSNETAGEEEELATPVRLGTFTLIRRDL